MDKHQWLEEKFEPNRKQNNGAIASSKKFREAFKFRVENTRLSAIEMRSWLNSKSLKPYDRYGFLGDYYEGKNSKCFTSQTREHTVCIYMNVDRR